VVALTLVVGSVTGTTGGSASASAAEVLNHAADLSAKATDFDLKPGQFLKITTTSELLCRVGPIGVGDGSARDTSGWIEKSEDILYVPADRSDDWVWVRGATPEAPGGAAERYFGAGGEQARQLDLGEHRCRTEIGSILRAPGGEYRGGVDGTAISSLGLAEDKLASMPLDGQELLGWYREEVGNEVDDPSKDSSVFEQIAGDLRWSLVPPLLREAMFRALALIPDVTLADSPTAPESNEPTATLRFAKDGGSSEMTLDTNTGIVLATAQYGSLLNRDGTSIYPPGTPTFVTKVATTVVDSAP